MKTSPSDRELADLATGVDAAESAIKALAGVPAGMGGARTPALTLLPEVSL